MIPPNARPQSHLPTAAREESIERKVARLLVKQEHVAMRRGNRWWVRSAIVRNSRDVRRRGQGSQAGCVCCPGSKAGLEPVQNRPHEGHRCERWVEVQAEDEVRCAACRASSSSECRLRCGFCVETFSDFASPARQRSRCDCRLASLPALDMTAPGWGIFWDPNVTSSLAASSDSIRVRAF